MREFVIPFTGRSAYAGRMKHYAEIAASLTSMDGGLTCAIPDTWRQGRTAYGGLTAALSLDATTSKFETLPPLRSAQINFIGPVTGDPVFTSELLRQGKNVTSIRTEGHVEGGCVACSVFIFGAERESTMQADFPAPDALKPEDCQDFAPEQFRKFLPAFTQNFDMKFIAGHRPATGADEGYIRIWARHKEPASRLGIGSLLCIGDVLPPATFPRMTALRPVSSVNWMMNIIAAPVTQDGWWHIETRETATRGGYASQVMRFWNTDGDLVAEGMQAVAIFV